MGLLILLTATILAFAVSSFTWTVLKQADNKKALTSRMAHVAEAPNEDSVDDSKTSKQFQLDTMSLDDSYKDPISRKLFLGGKRRHSDLKRYKKMRIYALIIPVALIGLQILSGTITQKSLANVLIIGVVLYLGVYSLANLLRKKRQQEILRAMPQFFDLLVIALEAGISFSAALPRVIEEVGLEDPLAQEFDILHHEFLAGLPFSEVCGRLSKRCEVQDLSVVMNALIESESLGTSLADILRVQASELRDKQKQRIREKAHRIPVKLLFPMMVSFTAIFVISIGPTGYKLTQDMAKTTQKSAITKKDKQEKPQKAKKRLKVEEPSENSQSN